ncbi:MAG: hypothetical protein M1832_006206 [Thelocarpon impressellum]|nr:MAG: hypothetical protein M1832_006206 [Thelocarpon impressellum]
MYTTKRKFHSLLNSLTATNPSSVSLPSDARKVKKNASTTTLPEDLDAPAKRRRVIGLRSSDLPRPRTVHTSIDTAKTTPEKSDVRKAPNFAPWDRGQFLARLKTFRHVDRWSAKPAQVNEVQWAKRGWSCVGKERVGCVGGCGKEVYIKLSDGREDADDNADAEGEWAAGPDEQLLARYVEMMVTEHEDDCLWRKRGCDDTIYHLSLINPAVSLAALGSRYKSLDAISSDLPLILSVPDGVDVGALTRELPKDVLQLQGQEDAASPAVNEQAFTLALIGWEAEHGHVKGLATCQACFRRLGLWLFKKKQTNLSEASETADDEASMSRLDVIAEHRDYCPWINATSQNGDATSSKRRLSSGDLAGWEALVRVLKTAQYLRPGSSGIPKPKFIEKDGPTEDTGAGNGPDEEIARDAKDKERWAKLKQLKRAFDVKSKRKSQSG